MAALLAQAITGPSLEPGARQHAAGLLDVVGKGGFDREVGGGTPTANARLRHFADEHLTERELEVLGLLAAGCSNQAIADELVIAIGTVKRHVNSIMGKFQVESRLEAVVRAREAGLV